MKYRLLGKSKLNASEVGLGCWQLGGDFGPLEDNTAENVIATALEQGISFFDTADVYGAGKSETYLGRMLPASNKDIKIATKYGRGPGTYPSGYSLNDMRNSVNHSLDRLQRDKIDLLQLHCVPTEVIKRGEIFDDLRTIQQEGLIANFGASVETLEEAHICLQHTDLTSLQIIFNLLRQRPIKELFDQAQANEVGIIVRLPLASGLLTGKFTRDTVFDNTDHRNYNKNGDAFSVGETFSGIEFSKGLELVDDLAAMKPDNYTMAQFAMRWILDHEAVTTIIPGASSAQQVIGNAAISSLEPIAPEIHEKLYDFYLEKAEPLIRCKV